jgi:phospholipid/cholesterol/gamma-HCH transport system ATP-binding protein
MTVGYDDTVVLKDVNFEVRAGEIFGILGGSGCGKSTLLKHMIGLKTPMKGAALIDGVDMVTAQGDERIAMLKKIGVSYQSGALFGSLNLSKTSPGSRGSPICPGCVETIAQMKLRGLAGYGRKMPAELSGSMKKRAIARAGRPKILFSTSRRPAGPDHRRPARSTRAGLSDLRHVRHRRTSCPASSP